MAEKQPSVTMHPLRGNSSEYPVTVQPLTLTSGSKQLGTFDGSEATTIDIPTSGGIDTAEPLTLKQNGEVKGTYDGTTPIEVDFITEGSAPAPLTFQKDGVQTSVYDGTAPVTVNIETPTTVANATNAGRATTAGTADLATKALSADKATTADSALVASRVANKIAIKQDGVLKGEFDGSAAVEVDFTTSSSGGVPIGGKPGEVLTKNTAADNDYGWKTPASVGVLEFYPVGSIYQTENADFDPSSSWGGTWSRIKGMVLIGVDEGQVEFSASKKTGGAKTLTLSASNMPSHTHSFTTGSDNASHSHTVSVNSDSSTHSHGLSGASTGYAGDHSHSISSSGAHEHKYWRSSRETKYGAGGVAAMNLNDVYPTEGTGDHTHTTNSTGSHAHSISASVDYASTSHSHSASANTAYAAHSHTGTTNSSGSGAAFSTLQPYYAVYIWRRTA